MKIVKLFRISLLSLLFALNLSAQETCDTAVLEQCKLSCDAAQPACTSTPPLTISEIRLLVSEKCGCTVSESTDPLLPDTCACETRVKNYGSYRSCVAQLSDAFKSFKLSGKDALDQLKADNTLCKSVIKGDKGNGNPGKGNKK